jgi:hypothetical protein
MNIPQTLTDTLEARAQQLASERVSAIFNPLATALQGTELHIPLTGGGVVVTTTDFLNNFKATLEAHLLEKCQLEVTTHFVNAWNKQLEATPKPTETPKK